MNDYIHSYSKWKLLEDSLQSASQAGGLITKAAEDVLGKSNSGTYGCHATYDYESGNDSTNYDSSDTADIEISPSKKCPKINFTVNDKSRRVPPRKVLEMAKDIFPELSKKAISGMLGHIRYEGQFNPTAYNSSGGGCGAFGIAQWRGSRYKKLDAYAKSEGKKIDDIEVQLGWMRRELMTSYSKVWNLLKQPDLSIRQYTAIVHVSFGLGSHNPNEYYKNIKDESSYISAYTARNGKSVKSIPKRYNYAVELSQMA